MLLVHRSYLNMKVVFITRSTLYKVYGGDTVQIKATAKYLQQMGVEVDICLCDEQINYTQYDLIHFFNITRPADVIFHARKSGKPYVVSTIFVDFSSYERANRSRTMTLLGKFISSDSIEYLKVIGRWIKNGESIRSQEYILQGHRKSVRMVAEHASMLLPNSESEYTRFVEKYGTCNAHQVIYNAVDPEDFSVSDLQLQGKREDDLVICVARIEGRKNQINLIRALNNTSFRLLIIGDPAPNHISYYRECKSLAADNVQFIDFMPQQELLPYYLKAKVHALPSWNETCGLSSLEAAYAGCNLVISPDGDTREYFNDQAWYCDPAEPQSILKAVMKAAEAPVQLSLHHKIVSEYNWHESARQTAMAYEKVMHGNRLNKPVRTGI